MQPGRAAERQQGVAARINAAPHRRHPHAVRHAAVDDAVDAGGGLGRCRSQARVPVWQPRRSPPPDPAPPATQEICRIEVAQHQVGVGDGRAGAALAVAGRTGNGAGAFRPDGQQSGPVQLADRPASGTQRHDVQARQRDAGVGDGLVAGQRRLAVPHHGDVGRGAAHVEADDVRRQARRGPAPPRPRRRRPGRTTRCRRQAVSPPATDATPPCDRMTSSSPAYPASCSRDCSRPEVVADHRADGRVGDGGGEPLELLDLRQHVE